MKITAVLFLICFGLAGCAPMTRFRHNENGWRPSELNPTIHTLLIVKGEKWSARQTEYITGFMELRYRFEYRFIERVELYSEVGEVTDKEKFRFALVPTYEEVVVQYYEIPTGYHSDIVKNHDFYFWDRLEGTRYPNSGIFASWPIMPFKRIIKDCNKIGRHFEKE